MPRYRVAWSHNYRAYCEGSILVDADDENDAHEVARDQLCAKTTKELFDIAQNGDAIEWDVDTHDAREEEIAILC